MNAVNINKNTHTKGDVMKKNILVLAFVLGAGVVSLQAGFFSSFVKGFEKGFKTVIGIGTKLAPFAGCAVEQVGGIKGGCAAGQFAGQIGGLLNAVGDVVVIDLSKLPVKELGRITETKTVDIKMPADEGKEVLSFIPTVNDNKGQLAGKKIWLAIYNQKQRPGSRLADRSVFIFYRHVEGEPKDSWTELARLTTLPGKKVTEPQPAKLAISANGVIGLGDNPSVEPDFKLWAAIKVVEKERSIAQPLSK